MAYLKKKCAFLDRDGVINEENGYISKIAQFNILPKTASAIKLLNNNNYLIIIITNQSGIGRGVIKLKELDVIHAYLKKKIKNRKAKIDDIFFCPYHHKFGVGKYKKKTNDRKPGSGMILKAIKKWNIDQKRSFMIGDKKRDFLAAKGAKIKFYYKSKNKNLLDQIKTIIKKKNIYSNEKNI
jgi:D-glycero-D-manno-heptose 1,7-bisphosphate phosphatase